MTRLISVLECGDHEQSLQAAAALRDFGSVAARALGQSLLHCQSPLACIRMIGIFTAIGTTLPPGERDPFLEVLIELRIQIRYAGIVKAVDLGIAELEDRGEH